MPAELIRCRIADLITDVPDTADLADRCREYRCDAPTADIVINETDLCPARWPSIPEEALAYMDSGFVFYGNLLRHNGLMLHASAVELEGRAYLFSGDCGAGKSTHTGLWREVFGPGARIINDDKPALRLVAGVWYAYGTPWSGKNGINQNRKAPLAGICFLKQAGRNQIRPLSPMEAAAKIMKQTIYRFKSVEDLDRMLHHVEALVRMIPIYELENRPEPDAVRLSFETMRRGAEE